MIQFRCPHCNHESTVADEYAGQTGPCTACGKEVTVPKPSPVYGGSAPAKSSGGMTVFAILGIVFGIVGVCAVPTICVLIALLLPAVQAAREAARRSQCTNNMKQIGLALHNYHDVNRKFPPAYTVDEDGNPLHSWRVLILPYMEMNHVYEQIRLDEPWDSPHNMAVTDAIPDAYRCPSSPDRGPFTSYVVVDTPGGMFNGAEANSFRNVTDGLSGTIAVVEDTEMSVRWNEPRDMTLDAGATANSFHPTGSVTLLGDGSVRFLSEDTTPEAFRQMVIMNDGAGYDQLEFDFGR